MHSALSIADIERIKLATNSSPPLTEDLQKRQQLKEACDKRVSTWSNTLAAQHSSRLEWKARKEEEKERRRQEIDKDEAELREQSRIHTIQRAQTLLNEQRDKVKFLRSQQVYQDVLETRKEQIAYMKSVSDEKERQEEIFHDNTMARIKEAEEEEKETSRRRNAQAMKLSREMKESMDKLKRELRRKQEQQKKDEAENIRKLNLEDSVIEQKTSLERLESAKKEKLDYYKMTKVMKCERDAAAKAEQEDSERREKIVLKMLENAQATRLLEKKNFERKEARKRLFYIKASQSLEQRSATEADRLRKDVTDIEQKQKLQDENLERAKKELNDAIHKSRQEQIDEKARKKAEENAKEKMYIQHILKTDCEEKERLNVEAQLRHEANKSLRRLQEAQSLECRRNREMEKIDELEEQRKLSKKPVDEDIEFCNFAALEIERLKSLRKNTTLIERTLRIAALDCANNRQLT